MDLDTTSPSTAATILTAHTIIVQSMASALTGKTDDNAKASEISTSELDDTKDGSDEGKGEGMRHKDDGIKEGREDGSKDSKGGRKKGKDGSNTDREEDGKEGQGKESKKRKYDESKTTMGKKTKKQKGDKIKKDEDECEKTEDESMKEKDESDDKNKNKPQDTMAKKPKWKKLLRRSVRLSELCLSSRNQELEEYALTFLFTIAKHSDTLHGYLPDHLLGIAWSALSHPDRVPLSTDSLPALSLEPVLLTASPDDYEKLLEDLIERTNRGDQLCHTLKLWRLIINSMVTGASGFLKRTALEHLIPILVNLATTQGTSEVPDCTVLHAVLMTLQEIIQTSIMFEDQTKAHFLVPCTAIELHKLPVDNFCQVKLFFSIFFCPECYALHVIILLHIPC